MGVRVGGLPRLFAALLTARWALILSVCLSAAACGYFDPLHPYPEPKPVDTSVTWEKRFGDGGVTVGNCVQQTADGGFVFTGYTDSGGAGGFDLWLVKTDATGGEQWSRTFGGTGDEYGRSVLQTPDGGYVVAGSTTSFGAGGTDVYLLKTDADGNCEWSNAFGGTLADEGWSVLCAAGGGYVIAGFTSTFDTTSFDPYLVKTNGDGDLVWDMHYGATACDDQACCVRQTGDGGYIIAGLTQIGTQGDVDVYLLKTDTAGTEQWCRHYGGDWPDYGTGVEQTADGGYILCGYTRSYGEGDFNAWLVKTDGSGIEQWNKAFGGDMYDRADCVRQTPDGGFILGGMTRSDRNWAQAWLVRTDSSGVQEWASNFGGLDDDWGLCVQLTEDGGYILSGYTESSGGGQDAYLIYYRR